MHARCSICQDTLGDANTPMTTLCGHLYCAECAAYQFANGDVCAICRTGPYELDALIRLFPHYEREPPQPPSPRAGGSGAQMEGGRAEAMVALHAYYDVLESEDVLRSPALDSALERTDDLVAALADIEAPDLRNLLANVVGLLGDIRAKIADAARLSELESQRDTLQTMARRLTERLREHQRARETEREAATEELTRLREEWTARIAALQEELQGTTAQLNTERAKVEQAKVVMTELDADAKKWQTQASRYKKKHHSLKKKHQAMETGIQDAFFGGDDSLDLI
ncbi:uncharacterized protein C8Q71DRAFT_775875 [Rhodofomes roseus]|uniref:RING-type domain-containing protein n=1 Tax=Rhodofomes roseus TaxID=34475 RepID=A0ABQ8K6V9_9APHY|nr:uncharacterized protein C8Q71DRAFT_775875 [Rhodofomes roseus]KAH9832985.1 hypothetical protein C8Q71DRAFT_775875 [Rhodofomes roseus]